MHTLINGIKRQSVWIAFIVFVVSLIPVLYCGLYNYASADDFAKSYEVHDVLLAGGSLFDAMWTAVLAAKEVWETWEGTWASNWVLAMQPSIWGEHVYAVTVPLCILYSAIGTGYLLYEILVCQLGLSKRAFWLLYWIQLFLFLQYMPYVRGGMFWYTGMAHYIMPMCLALLMMAWMFKWIRIGWKRYLIFMILDAVYIGGSHYQQIILVLLVLLSGWLWIMVRRGVEHEKICRGIHALWIPMIIFLIGLVICIKSPGNVARGGEEFGFNAVTVALMPISCVIEACGHIVEYVQSSPLLLAYAVLLVGMGWKCIGKERTTATFRKAPAAIVVLYLFLLYASTEAAAIYATGNTNGISGGYYDIVYQSLLLVMSIGIPFAAMRLRDWIARRQQVSATKSPSNKVVKIGWFVCTVVLVLIGVKPAIKGSAAWTCYTFARGGQLDDFVIQMEERIALLNDANLKDIYLPEMNSEQGPFMHLQLSQDATNYTNEATAMFYHKNTVTAVPRDEYYSKYAEIQGHDIPEEYREQYASD